MLIEDIETIRENVRYSDIANLKELEAALERDYMQMAHKINSLIENQKLIAAAI